MNERGVYVGSCYPTTIKDSKADLDYVFNEGEYLRELAAYIDSTYGDYYAKDDKLQATQVIIDSGHGTGFCIGNMIKYSKRYGKKGSLADARKDLLKVIHYGIIAIYNHDMKYGVGDSDEK